MLIHGFIAHSQVNGPGVRSVVYFQGCNLGCASCWNPATHAFTGLSREAQDVAEQVAAAHRTRVIDGVTFSGGEPMQQALDLLDLIRLLNSARCRIWEDINQLLDFAVLGRFVASRPSRLPMRTSANQVLRLFSDRYREEHFRPLECEVHIESEGLVQITGFPLAGLPI